MCKFGLCSFNLKLIELSNYVMTSLGLPKKKFNKLYVLTSYTYTCIKSSINVLQDYVEKVRKSTDISNPE